MGVLVGKPAPDFTCAAVLGNGEIVDNYTFSEAIKGKYGLLFFYPLDFTFVCPSELIALNHRVEAFKKLGVEVVAVSIDSQFTHNAWRNTPVDQGGIGQEIGRASCRERVERAEGAGAIKKEKGRRRGSTDEDRED